MGVLGFAAGIWLMKLTWVEMWKDQAVTEAFEQGYEQALLDNHLEVTPGDGMNVLRAGTPTDEFAIPDHNSS